MGRKKGCRMSTRITHQADGTARGQTQQNTANSIIDLRKQPARTPKLLQGLLWVFFEG